MTPEKYLTGSNDAREMSTCTAGSSADDDQVGVAACGLVLGEPPAQVVDALRLEEVVEGAHLGAVVGAAEDLLRATGAQLRVPRGAVAAAGEDRPYPGAVELRRRRRAGTEGGEPDAALLPAFDAQRAEDAVLHQPDPTGADRAEHG